VTPFVALLLWLQVGAADPVAGGGGGGGAVDVDLASAAASGREGGGLMMMSIEVHRAGMFHNSPRILTLSMRRIKIAAHDTSTKRKKVGCIK